MEECFAKLEWDSDFFGFDVARITRLDLDASQLASALQELNGKRYRLVYWNIPIENQPLVEMAKSLGGFMADEKVTYIRELSNLSERLPDGAISVSPYTAEAPDPALLSLALNSGDFSRFKLDPLFPAKLAEKLYICWITRSVRKEIAWQVLVAKEGRSMLGMITLGEKDTRGNIGLAAVSPAAKGRRIGRLLLAAADRSFSARGYSLAQVVTQRANKSACRLYEASGYRVEKIENVLHFWLSTNENTL